MGASFSGSSRDVLKDSLLRSSRVVILPAHPCPNGASWIASGAVERRNVIPSGRGPGKARG
jgi:hypothetical protein